MTECIACKYSGSDDQAYGDHGCPEHTYGETCRYKKPEHNVGLNNALEDFNAKSLLEAVENAKSINQENSEPKEQWWKK